VYDRLVVALADLRARIPSIITQARAARAQSVDLRRQREAIAQDTVLQVELAEDRTGIS